MSSFVINPYAFGGEDPDAAAYLNAVEVEDGQSLEAGVRKAVDDFVKGLKADGIWSAIKACCILAGARTLDGALTPLVGTAPTNNNFVSGDYDREDGLVGNGSTKYLDSNRNNNADPQDDKHVAVYASTISSGNTLFNSAQSGAGRTGVAVNGFVSINNSTSVFASVAVPVAGLTGIVRNNSSNFTYRTNLTNSTVTVASGTPNNGNISLYARIGTPPDAYTTSRLSFYSIGESLDLADLDTRVSTLITDLAAAIP